MRYITPYILEDLNKKMVFVGGPRQVRENYACQDTTFRKLSGRTLLKLGL